MSRRRTMLQERSQQAPRLPEGPVKLGDGRTLYPDESHAVWLREQYARDGLRVNEKQVGSWSTVDHLRVHATIDPTTLHGPLLHVSFSYPALLPGWRDVGLVRAAFFSEGTDAMIVLPRRSLYVNIHPYTHHLWQMPVPWGIS